MSLWVLASAGKAKAGMVSGWTRGVQLKLWDPLRMRAIPERLRGVFTTRRYTNPRLPYLILPYVSPACWIVKTHFGWKSRWPTAGHCAKFKFKFRPHSPLNRRRFKTKQRVDDCPIVIQFDAVQYHILLRSRSWKYSSSEIFLGNIPP